MERQIDLLELDEAAQLALIAGARYSGPVNGLTHDFYKYPARFSPQFVRAAIQSFTRPGGVVLDPHVGGGTTLVEALAAGRDAVGVDISTLAEFVSNTKTTVYSEAELGTLDDWSRSIAQTINLRADSHRLTGYAAKGYYKHLDHPTRWRLRKAIEQSLWSASGLGSTRLESFGRCAVLRSAQWALDGRRKQASINDFREFLHGTAIDMVAGARSLSAVVIANGSQSSVEIIQRSAAGLEDEYRLRRWRTPQLVVTSPPYPGVHVLYHRWQVDGRKEAPLPFMIANKLDGAGSSYYTMGDRKYPELRTYFRNIAASLTSVAALADSETVIVQMVAFHEPEWQLPRYLAAMTEAGLREVLLPKLKGEGDGRLWRSVPGRRWYSAQRGTTPGSEEVVLFHLKANITLSQFRGRRFVQRPTGLPAQAS